jgi:hypothetical protein
MATANFTTKPPMLFHEGVGAKSISQGCNKGGPEGLRSEFCRAMLRAFCGDGLCYGSSKKKERGREQQTDRQTKNDENAARQKKTVRLPVGALPAGWWA